MDSNADNIPDHLRLAAHWATTTIAHAQDSTLSNIQSHILHTQEETTRQQTLVDSINKQFATIQDTIQEETQVLGNMAVCGQIDALGALLDALEKDLDVMEDQVSKAEAAVGLTLGGRLEQLARFLGPKRIAEPGIPYLRQWAPKANINVTKVSDYI
ncbi:hypothetical protein GGI25_005018 [Coemansia spiralis]|uniref:Uncharacterized protein n=2 Tax=Coemansia TaxID=4863 RepID=A0A9W8G5C6_9FUNG|nr:hypothetical protein BX070DRAFT_236932 [Coemansia spiralis]KAJ1989222.1 hypothetical protein EDC05_004809 [Coemansia umbellata]KAJ2620187.1 hypothetical protein GGI26_005202 [Coemansia sp. RSA 1358]KAJ2672647.1 hypothetical protein GGI25_005018 [Coemansia spiralis]